MQSAKEHYGTRMGLLESMTDENGLVYYKAWDEKDHHSIVLRETDCAGMDHFAFKVYDDATLTELEGKIRAFGLDVEKIPAGVYPKSGRRLKFILPTGHEMHLYAEKEYVGNTLGLLNPGVIPDEGVVRGFRISGLDHCLLFGPDIEESVRFFLEVCDFDLTEKIVDGDGNPVLLFVSCSLKPHDIAFGLNTESGAFHHAAFKLDTPQDHIHAADLIGKHRIPVEVIDRHGVTRVKTIYYFDPSGNRNEVFCDGYTYYPDSPVLTWPADNLAAAGFSQSLHVPDSFLGVYT